MKSVKMAQATEPPASPSPSERLVVEPGPRTPTTCQARKAHDTDVVVICRTSLPAAALPTRRPGGRPRSTTPSLWVSW